MDEEPHQPYIGYGPRRFRKFSEVTEDVKVNTVRSDEDSDHESVFSVCTSKRDFGASDLLLVDSGCTSHIQKTKDNFESFTKDFIPKSQKITLADGSQSWDAVKGVGKAKEILIDSNGEEREIFMNNVLYIPEFGENIFSVYRCIQNGHTVTFSPNGSTLTTKKGTIFNIITKNKMFYLQKSELKEHNPRDEIKQVKAEEDKTEEEKFSKIKNAEHSLEDWHKMLGHCNVADIKRLESVVRGMKITNREDFDCATCVLGKTTNQINKIQRTRADKPLQLVHCDLTGPMNVEAKGGFKYGINFVDDSSGLTKVYLLKSKSDAYQALKIYIAETAAYGKFQRLRVDHGTEFTCKEFRNVCIDNKINLEFSSPRSPHQNGTAERNHRTIYSMARCLLLQSGLPKNLWSYAVKMAAHIRNRCYNNRTACTPIEKFTGNRPNLSKLALFGGKCFAYKSEGSGKLDARCNEGIFIGYDSESPAYLVYFPTTQKVKKERLVKFIKEQPRAIVAEQQPQQQPEQQPEQHVEVTPLVHKTSDLAEAEDQPIGTEDVQTATEDLQVTASDSGSLESRGSRHQGAGSGSSEFRETPMITEQRQVTDLTETSRRSSRIRNPPAYLADYVVDGVARTTDETFINNCYRVRVDDVPKTYKQAMNSASAPKWKDAMDAEMQSLKENETFELVPPPADRAVVGGRWVFSVKTSPAGEKHKARYVAQGFSQEKNIDYDETFAPTARMSSLRVFLQIAASLQLLVHQMDVRTAYLNAELDREVFVRQPQGYEVLDEEGNPFVCRLKKSLYGLKQSGRLWNETIHKFFISNGFNQSKADHCIYCKHEGGKIILILLWVDDIIIASNCKELLIAFKNIMK